MGTIINGIIGGFVFLVVALVGMSGVALVTEPAREAEQKSQHEQSVAQWQSQTMEWVRLPGKIPELKQMNLSDCNSDYYGYTCQSKTINLFGVPIQEVKISLTPDGQYSYRERNSEFAKYNKFTGDVRNVPMEDLGYDYIYLTLADDRYDYKCMDKLDTQAQVKGEYSAYQSGWGYPKTCLKNKGASYFTQTLKENGWRYISRNEQWIHPDYLITIYDERNHNFRLTPISADERKTLLDEWAQKQQTQTQMQNNAQNVLNALKN